MKGINEIMAQKADAHHSHEWSEINGMREKFHEQNLQMVDQQAQLEDKADTQQMGMVVQAAMSHYGGATENHEITHIVGLSDKLSKYELRLAAIERTGK